MYNVRMLKIATWNIAGGRTLQSLNRFDYSPAEDIDYFCTQLKDLNLDVICLQESHANGVDSLAKRIAARLGMSYVFDTPGCPSHIDSSYRLTTAIISKTVPLNQLSIMLPKPSMELRFRDSGKQVPPLDRYLQVAILDGFTIANIHTEPMGAFGYDYESGQGLELAHQMDDILATTLTQPVLFAADFNIEKPGIALPKTFAALGLQEGLPAQTTTKPHGGSPDHILYSPTWTLLDAGVLKTKTDHYLCWAQFN
jgi:exonuclease III